MTFLTRTRFLPLFAIALCGCATVCRAASLPHGHVRANTRAWVHGSDGQREDNTEPRTEEPAAVPVLPTMEVVVQSEEAPGMPEAEDAMTSDVDSEQMHLEDSSAAVGDELPAEGTYEDYEPAGPDRADASIEPPPEASGDVEAVADSDPVAERAGLGRRLGNGIKSTLKGTLKTSRSGLVLIGKRLRPEPAYKGYLASGPPNALRFSDLDPVQARPQSPALPEFNQFSVENIPYLIETPLPEDAMNDLDMLSEVVIEMETHEIVSGRIDTRRSTQEERVEHFDLEEQRTSVLRPEEVLIFFETDTNTQRTEAVVPFSPATPSSVPTINSSATLKKE